MFRLYSSYFIIIVEADYTRVSYSLFAKWALLDKHGDLPARLLSQNDKVKACVLQSNKLLGNYIQALKKAQKQANTVIYLHTQLQ